VARESAGIIKKQIYHSESQRQGVGEGVGGGPCLCHTCSTVPFLS